MKKSRLVFRKYISKYYYSDLLFLFGLNLKDIQKNFLSDVRDPILEFIDLDLKDVGEEIEGMDIPEFTLKQYKLVVPFANLLRKYLSMIHDRNN